MSSHTKRLLKIVFTASLLGARDLREVVENQLTSLLVESLGKALNGTPHLFMWKTGGPDASKMTTPKRVRTSILPKYSNRFAFLLTEVKYGK